MNEIKIKDIINFNPKHLSFILDVDFENETAVIGCSIRNEFNHVTDFPLRILVKKGRCEWLMLKEKNLHDLYNVAQENDIRFSIWNNESCSVRLADTDWQHYLIESGSSGFGEKEIIEMDNWWLLPYNEKLWKKSL